MFKGWHERTIDEKGRVSIPSKFRDILVGKYNGEAVITCDFDPCLVIYPLKKWDEFEKKVSLLPQFSKAVVDLKRVYISAAQECEIDRQGRIIIPQTLRDYAGLIRDLMVVGQTTTIQIWASEKWAEYLARSKEEFDRSKLAELGL